MPIVITETPNGKQKNVPILHGNGKNGMNIKTPEELRKHLECCVFCRSVIESVVGKNTKIVEILRVS